MAVVKPTRPRPVASVVIPAHDEERVLGRCLRALSDPDDGADSPVQIIVAANGCTDGTVAVARSHPHVQVVELPTASKAAALNAGDDAAQAFPRIYLDADVVLIDGALPGLVETLQTDLPRVAAPQVRFDTTEATWPVRWFYRIYRQLPYATDGLVGLGVYGLSAQGRARFQAFPDLHGDDLFVQRLFAPHERLTSPGAFVVRVPRTLPALIRVRTRSAQGNAALAAAASTHPATDVASSTRHTLAALGRLVLGNPRLLPAAAVYLAVSVRARYRARQAARSEGPTLWLRDETTR